MSEEDTQSAGLGSEMSSSEPAQTETQESTSSVDFSSPDMYKQFVDTLPEDIRGSKAFLETENLPSLANQLLNAQSALGKKRLEAPQEDWTQDNWNEFYSHLRPADDEYSVAEVSDLTLPEDLADVQAPELHEEGLQAMVDLAGQMGLTQQQFDVMYASTVESLMRGGSNEQTVVNDSLKQYKMELMTEWKEDFDVNLAQSKEAFSALAQDIPELNELVQDPTIANHPGMLKLFHKVAKVSGDTLPSLNNNVPNGFGENSSMNIQAQIKDIDAVNQELILSNPSQLSPLERSKRDQILNKRAELYSKLYG